jgi:5-methylthioadenosine/S-adenosylhomocysteine deaminase
VGDLRVAVGYALLVLSGCGGSGAASGGAGEAKDAGPVDASVEAGVADAGVDSAVDATTSPDASGDSGAPATVMLGASDRILLVGTVVTPDVTFEGEVLVEGGTITCAAVGSACEAQTGAAGATVIDTHGVIAPGLIDTHNHILFDVFDDDDWLPSQTYTNHNQWPSEPRYQAMLDVKQCLEDASQGKPAWCPTTYDGDGSLKCEMDKWGELKGMIAGTTSIVGLPGTSSACFGSLSRSIDVAQNGLGSDTIQTSALFPPSRASGDGVCANFTSMKTDAYLIHDGEGTDSAALAEFAKLGTLTTTADCLYAPQTTITHGTAFTANEFAQMAAYGMKLTWSPKSNVALYAATTDIPAALGAGVLVTLAPDWSMGGSQNLLDELRFADAWDNQHFGDVLAARDLVLMSTKNAAIVLGLDGVIGSIAPGLAADLVVVSPKAIDPYASIVAATPADVRLTMVGGQILYGDLALQPAAPAAPGCEAFDACGAPKFLCVATTTTTDKLDETYAQIASALDAAMTNVDTLTPTDGFSFAPVAPMLKCP